MQNLTPGAVAGLPPGIVQKYFQLRGMDFVHFGVSDDGSCFFHAVAAALNIDNYHHRSPAEKLTIGRNLRRRLERTLTPASWARYWASRGIALHRVPDVHEVIRKMRNPSEWSDVYMIMYIMDTLGLNIVFFDSQTDSIYCGVRGTAAAQKTVFVLWVNRIHFEPIFGVRHKKVRTSFRHDDAVVRHVMSDYDTTHCKNASLESVL